MNLLSKIIACTSDEEAFKIIDEQIKIANENSNPVDQLGFLDYGKNNSLHKGFIPLKAKINYDNFAMETYGMGTVDFFYEFTSFIRKYNINNKHSMICSLEHFINGYFGYSGKVNRSTILNDIAWKNTETDEEYFAALDNNKLGDLKGKGAAECTERAALAQQVLSLFDTETYYCMGCVDLGDRQEGHCFNIVKRKNDYALLDYSVPVTAYNEEGSVRGFYPFIGEMSNEEFEEFTQNGVLKSFDNYEFLSNNVKHVTDTPRTYVVGSFEISKEPLRETHR